MRTLLAALLVLAPLPSLAARDGDYATFAAQVEETMTRGDGTLLRRAFDCDKLLKRALDPIEAPAVTKEAFSQGAAKSCDEFANQVSLALGKGFSSYKLLRLRRVGVEERALFRMIVDGSLNYHDLVLEKRGSRVRVVDAHVFLTGERLSTLIRRTFLSAGLSNPKDAMGSEFVKALPKIQEMQALRGDGRYGDALRVYHGLPEAVRKERVILVERFVNAAEVGGKEYEDAIADFRKYFPDDGGLDLMMIDGFFLKGQYDEALAALDRLDRSVGGDPYLKVMRANVFTEKNDLAKAKTLLNQAKAEEPSLIQVWFGLIGMSLLEKKHAETARLLTDTEKRFDGITFQPENTPEYADFVKSKEYVAWKKQRKPPVRSDPER